MRKALYYLSWAVLVAFFSIYTIGSLVVHGPGPMALALVVLAAGAGVIFLQ